MKNTTEKDARGPWAKGGDWLTDLRRARQITPAELAEQAGAPSARWIEEIEAGRRPVPSVLYGAFARELGLEAPAFAAGCLKFYDPKAYEALFGAATAEVVPFEAAHAA